MATYAEGRMMAHRIAIANLDNCRVGALGGPVDANVWELTISELRECGINPMNPKPLDPIKLAWVIGALGNLYSHEVLLRCGSIDKAIAWLNECMRIDQI